MPECPSEEQLAGLLLGGSLQKEAPLRAHVTACSRCAAWLAEHEENDAVLDTLRRVMDADAAGPDLEATATLATAPMRHRSAIDAAEPADETVPGGFSEYELLEEVGRGGMGVVYRALQRSTKRQVALKVLLEGPVASQNARRRFEREVELAAQLQHPHIVTILESGISSGRYYFAMQYVEGQRLDRYVADRALGVKDVLSLFATICQAVNYAHQRGVIHRDLKPSNIIVDSEGRPHVLDFGLAKVRDESQEEQSLLLSMPGQVMGTLPYMSPEQAGGAVHDVDIRTDIYSLGVILYELLTGQYPYLVIGRLVDVLRNIAQAEPERPSAVQKGIRADVETIVLKALAKERDRRYQSAENLGRDIERYLQGLPIEARRDSTTYVLRKLLWRHRLPVAAASAFVLVALASVTLVLQHRARLEVAHDLAAATDLTAAAVHDPAGALERLPLASPRVRAHLVELCKRYVSSQAYTERVMGARLGFLVNPESFWTSVDGGPLWHNGEWLELCTLLFGAETAGERASEGSVSVLNPAEIMAMLANKARSGTNRQKYVAFCLIGHLAPFSATEFRALGGPPQTPSLATVARALPGGHARDEQPSRRPTASGDQTTNLLALCQRALETEHDPGVIAAAAWAARQLESSVDDDDPPALALLLDEQRREQSLEQSRDREGAESARKVVEQLDGRGVLVDQLTGMPFVRIPAAAHFRRGSGPDDPDRMDDEDRPEKGVPIGSFFLSMHEVTLEAFAPFFWDAANADAFGPLARGEMGAEGIAGQLAATPSEEWSATAVSWVSLKAARGYCRWLNGRAGSTAETAGTGSGRYRRYRLPTEDEWEYACRAGNGGRFCFGNDAQYLKHFARCDGVSQRVRAAAERMPNAYGLFDMHGGLWELCDSPYTARPGEAAPEPAALFVQRGGAYYSPAVRCRSAQRNYIEPHAEWEHTGFRLVLEWMEP